MQAELIIIFIATFVLARYWKMTLFLCLCALASVTVVGMVAAIGFLAR